MNRILPASLLCLGLLACGGQPAAPPPDAEADAILVAEGRALAVAHCSSCHALDGIAESPNPAAPPMTDLLDRYEADRLADDLIDGIRVGHDEMPEFDLPVTAADALVAYLKSIRKP